MRKIGLHGLPHVERVKDNLKLLIDSCPKLDQQTIKLLKIVVEVHDVGRKYEGDHAKNFANMACGIDMGNLSESEYSAIIYAVTNHSIGLPGLGIKKAESFEQKLLGLLVLLDHMDAIGEIGFLRPFQWSLDSKKYLPILSKIKFKDLDRFLEDEKITPEIMSLRLKEESIVAHLIYNYLATYQIIEPVAHLLSPEFVGHIKNRNLYLLERIDEMMKIMEENDSLKE